MVSSSSSFQPFSFSNQQSTSVLTSLPFYDNLLAEYHVYHPQNIIREEQFTTTSGMNRSVIDLVDLRTLEEEFWDDDGNQTDPLWLPHCHIVGMLPFSPRYNSTKASRNTYEEAVAMALALQHLNTGNDSIVDELGQIYIDEGGNQDDNDTDTINYCANMAFTLEFLDTHFTPGAAIDDVFEFSGRSGSRDFKGLRPCSFMGAYRSAVTLPTSLLTGHRGYVQVSASSTSFQLDEKDQYPLFARAAPSDLHNVIPLLEYFGYRLRVTHLAVLTMNEAFGQSFGQSMQWQASQITPNMRILRISLDENSPQGIERALHSLHLSKYRYVMVAVFTKDLHNDLLTRAVDYGLAGNGKHQWFFPDSFRGTIEENTLFEPDSKLRKAYQGVGFFTLATEGGQNAYYNLPSLRGSNKEQSDGKNNKKENIKISLPPPVLSRYDRFVQQLKAIKNDPGDMAYLNKILPQLEGTVVTSTGSEVVDNHEIDEDDNGVNDETNEDIEEATLNNDNAASNGGNGDAYEPPIDMGTASNHTGSTVSDSLGGFGTRFTNLPLSNFPHLHDSDFLDPPQHDSAAYMYDATILMGLSACRLIQKKMGASFSGKEHFDMLTKTSFRGITGRVEVDPTTGSRTFNSTTYKLVNFVEDYVKTAEGVLMIRFNGTVTDLYENGEWKSRAEFVFNDGTTNLPPSLPPPDGDGNYVLPGIRGTSWTFAFISMLLSIGFAVWTYRNRKTRIVKASQPFFLYLICFGVLLVASSTIPFTFDSRFAPQEACTRACLAAMWLLFLGVSVVFSALFTKAYRINLIMMNAQKFRRVTITVAETLRPMAALLALNLIILSTMTALHPPQYTTVIVQSSNDYFGRPREFYGQCAYQEQAWYFLALSILNGGILFLSVVQSWRARGLATEFSESKYVFLALTATTIVVFVGAPVLILARDNPDAVVFLGSAIIFVFCMTILLLMFVPKITFGRKKKTGKKVKISGLDLRKSRLGRVTRGRNTKAPFDLEAPEASDSLMLRLSVPTSSEQTDDSTTTGERILTTKSAKELALLVNRLQRKLEAQEAEIRVLKKQRERCTSDTMPTCMEELNQNSKAIDREQEDEKMQQLEKNLVEQFDSTISEDFDRNEENSISTPQGFGNVEKAATSPSPSVEQEVEDTAHHSFHGRFVDGANRSSVIDETEQASRNNQQGRSLEHRMSDEAHQALSTRQSIFRVPRGSPLSSSDGSVLSILSPSKQLSMIQMSRKNIQLESCRENRHDDPGGLSNVSGGSSGEEETRRTIDLQIIDDRLTKVGTW